ncbi:MAG TPA: hypothetical protein H9889_06455, partial [Candidatus Ignatzschineria merdigallinarum]|nr:hypothetical protein [Candidatus Ignatzschineria merdigallinarum]
MFCLLMLVVPVMGAQNQIVLDSRFSLSHHLENNKSASNRDTMETMSLSFHDVSLTYLMSLLAAESGRNIVVPPSVEQKITLNLVEMTFDEILEIILLYTNLQKVEKHNVIFLTNHKDFQRLEKGKLTTEVMKLNYAEAEELLTMLDK